MSLVLKQHRFFHATLTFARVWSGSLSIAGGEKTLDFFVRTLEVLIIVVTDKKGTSSRLKNWLVVEVWNRVFTIRINSYKLNAKARTFNTKLNWNVKTLKLRKALRLGAIVFVSVLQCRLCVLEFQLCEIWSIDVGLHSRISTRLGPVSWLFYDYVNLGASIV